MLSVVTRYGRDTWPVYTKPNATPPLPIVIEKPVERIPSQEEWDEFLEICDKAAKWDELMGEPECVDPEKDAWMEEIERRLAELEKPKNPFSFSGASLAKLSPTQMRGIGNTVDPAGGHSINY